MSITCTYDWKLDYTSHLGSFNTLDYVWWPHFCFVRTADMPAGQKQKLLMKLFILSDAAFPKLCGTRPNNGKKLNWQFSFKYFFNAQIKFSNKDIVILSFWPCPLRNKHPRHTSAALPNLTSNDTARRVALGPTWSKKLRLQSSSSMRASTSSLTRRSKRTLFTKALAKYDNAPTF